MVDSQKLMRQIARAGAGIAPELTDRDVERLVQGAARRRQRQKARARALLATTAAGAAALALVHFIPAHGPAPVPAPQVAASAASPLRLSDGSLATPTGPGSTLAVLGESPQKVEVALRRGGARFEVVRAPKRAFSVQAGDVTVTVLGTVFTVERVADRIGVTVERGTVRVDWKVGTRELHRGESGWFPPLVVDSGGAPAEPARQAAPVVPPRRERERESIRTAARSSAAVATAPAGGRETAEQLLAAADGERLAGHPGEGAAILQRLLCEHRHDARAPLAAFTLGRLLLMELDRPRDAAAAFAEVRALAPRGDFAEDALAREIEAWRRAGDGDRARARAEEYLRIYPKGRRVEAVKRFGELD